MFGYQGIFKYNQVKNMASLYVSANFMQYAYVYDIIKQKDT